MRRPQREGGHRRLAGRATVLVLGAAALAACSSSPARGDALAAGDGYVVGAPVKAGHWVEVAVPALENASDIPVTFESARLVDVPDGVTTGPMVVHKAADTDGVPLTWSQDVDPASPGDPGTAPTYPPSAVRIAPGSRSDYYVLLTVTPTRPGTFELHDVEVTYTEDGRTYQQVLPVTLHLDVTA